MRQKHRTIGNNRASSRRLVFVGRLHTSATSPLMKASRRLDLGGISPIMGPRNPGGCYFRKKKAPARNAPVVVGIGGSIWVVFPPLWVPEIQGGVISGKKGPCQECSGCRRNWFSQEIPNSKNSDKKSTIFRKGTRGKMTPQVFSIQCQSPVLFIHEINSF